MITMKIYLHGTIKTYDGIEITVDTSVNVPVELKVNREEVEEEDPQLNLFIKDT